MAEEEGFEPTCPLRTPVFKTGEPPLLNSSKSACAERSEAERARFELARALRLRGLANPRNGPNYATSPELLDYTINHIEVLH